MKLQDFRVGLRLLFRHPAYSLVSVLGLGVGLAVCLLVFGFARYSGRYDAHVPDVEHVYIVKQRNNLDLGTPWYDQAPLLLREVAMTAPGVTSASGYVNWFPLTVQVNGQLHELKSLTVLPGFAEMMGLHPIKGDLNEALSRPDRIALTQSTAVRLFGTSDALARTVLVSTVHEDSRPASIAAILPDPPTNTTIPFEALNGLNLGLVPPPFRAEALTGEHGYLGNLLLRTRPGASPAAIEEVLQRAVDHAPSVQNVPLDAKSRLGGRKIMDIKLSPLRKAYFDREVSANKFSRQVDRGNATVVAGLVAIAILVLALAAINYINLTTLRMMQRQREIGMRKALGAGRSRIVLQFLAESLLVAMLATAIGILLACLMLPVFAELMSRDLKSLLSLENMIAALKIGLAIGVLTAIYPVWISLGVRPAQMLAGRSDSEPPSRKRLRQALSVLQMTVAIGLASFTLAIGWQTRFAIHASPGFDVSSLLVVDLPVSDPVRESEKARAFVAALSHQPAVAGIAVSNDAVGRPNNRWSTEIKREGGQSLTMDVKSVSANFFEVHGIQAVAGRLFDPKMDREDDAGPIVINAIGARKLGFTSAESAVGQTLLFRTTGSDALALIAKRIVGVAPEIRHYSLREPPGAMAYELWTAGTTLTVRARGSISEAERAVRATWPQYFSNVVPKIDSAQDIYAANYADDSRLAQWLALATVIAMVIAAFGIYVLAADAVQRRTREIALRKLSGAQRVDIGRLIAREMGAIMIISTAIAAPLALFAITRYLEAYTDRTPLAFWALPVAIALSLTIASFAAVRQAWQAMALKPAIALRA